MKLGILGFIYFMSMAIAPVKAFMVGIYKLKAMGQIWQLMQMGKMTKGVAFFRAIGMSAQTAAKSAGLFGAMLGRLPGIKMLGGLLGGAGRAVMMLGRTLFLTVPGVGLLALAAVLVYKYWKPIKAFFAGLWDGLKKGLASVSPAFDGLLSVFSGLWTKIQP
ncbi:hypothetical protein E4T85_21015, partial [Bacillus stratosphericus]